MSTQSTATAKRSALSYEDVAAIADAMVAANEVPTLRAILARHGSGSLSTIQKFLNEWKERQRQAVTKSATLSEALQRLMLGAIAQAVSEARVALEQELAGVKADCDTFNEENEAQTGVNEMLSAQLAEIQAVSQQQIGVIEQLRIELEKATQSLANERENVESARLALAKAELRLEALPRVEAVIKDLRDALDTEKRTRATGERSAAVSTAIYAGKLDSAEIRLSDSAAREWQAVAKLAEVEKLAKATETQAQEFRYLHHDAEQRAKALEQEVQELKRARVSAS